MPTKEAILARKMELDVLRQQHMANMNACVGAMQDCDHWLALIEADDHAAWEAETAARKINAAAEDQKGGDALAKPN